jgi:uncharacterized protein
MRPIARLAELNEIDLLVESTKVRLAQIAEALREPAAMRGARLALAESEAELAQAQEQQRNREQAQKRAAEKLAIARQHLYSGRVTNSKELENLEAELEQLIRQLSHAEDELLETLITVETAAEKSATNRATLARLTAETEIAHASLRVEQTRLVRRLAVDQARQAAARTAVPSHLLPSYDALRARRGGRAVATLDGDTCGACRVAVSPTKVEAARYGDDLVYCENCGRLLWGE